MAVVFHYLTTVLYCLIIIKSNLLEKFPQNLHSKTQYIGSFWTWGIPKSPWVWILSHGWRRLDDELKGYLLLTSNTSMYSYGPKQLYIPITRVYIYIYICTRTHYLFIYIYIFFKQQQSIRAVPIQGPIDKPQQCYGIMSPYIK